jgi:hypothetical protein
LADLERPVAARGVVLLERVLTDGSGPLYDRDRQDEFDPGPDPRRAGAALMVEILGIVIAVACFAAALGLIVLLDRV